jgi:hypothetical protein
MMVQDYGVGSVWTMSSLTPAGTYTVTVDVRTSSAAVVPDASASAAYVFGVVSPTPATGVAIAIVPGSPSFSGTSLVVTATGSGSTTSGVPTPPAYYDFQFWTNINGSGWTVAQTYGHGATFTIPAPTQGTYQVLAQVRTSSLVAVDAMSPISTQVVTSNITPATAVTLTDSPVGSSLPGAPVTFTALGSGSTTAGAQSPATAYDYQFWVNSNGAGWYVAQPYGNGNRLSVLSPTAANVQVLVQVRTSSLVAADATSAIITHAVVNPVTPATAVSLADAPVGTSAPGVNVTFTATGSGSTTNGIPTLAAGYDYQFWTNTNSAGWVVSQSYGNGSMFTMVAPIAASYQVLVQVRTTNLVAVDVMSSFVTHTVQ